jgi:hypothetical protein
VAIPEVVRRGKGLGPGDRGRPGASLIDRAEGCLEEELAEADAEQAAADHAGREAEEDGRDSRIAAHELLARPIGRQEEQNALLAS